MKNYVKVNFPSIVRRSMQVLGFDKQEQLAEKTGNEPTNFTNKKRRGSGELLKSIINLVIENDDKVNLHWLITGEETGTQDAQRSYSEGAGQPIEGGEPMDESKVIRSLRALISQQQATIDDLLDQIDDSKKSNAVSE